MALRVWGEPLLTADATGNRVFSPFIPAKNVILRAIRFRVIFNNDPTLTSIAGRIHANDNGSVGPKIADSTDSRTKLELITQGNGVVESYLTFNDLPLRSGDTYYVLLTLNGYTGTASSHVAWEKAWPDPVLVPPGHDFNSLLTNPRYVYFITAEL